MEIRRLTVADTPECMKLITDRGWTWTPEQWELMLTLGPGLGAFDGSAILGTTLATPYPEALAISGVLVGSWAGRRGIATTLISNILDMGSPVSVLYATPMAERLYERLGFHSVGDTSSYFGEFTGEASGVTRWATSADLDELVALDREVSGYSRRGYWEQVLASPNTFRRHPHGVIGARPNPAGLTVGPLIAPDADVAGEMIADVAAGAGPVRVDTGDAGVAAFLLKQGFELRDGGCRLMVRGADDVPGDRSRYFAPASHALG